MMLTLDEPVLARGVNRLALDQEMGHRRVNRIEGFPLGRETLGASCYALRNLVNDASLAVNACGV